MNAYHEVLFEELEGNGGNLGVITLNRPQVLNSLNDRMIRAMYEQLMVWSSAKHIKAVVIRAAEGRAFCAGGDLRHIYDRIKSHDPEATKFFYDEYRLNQLIFHYPKPYIALMDGVTMGGGVGVSIHGSHRVATDRLMFAMPETGIGFYPDVGGTYFLPRLPDSLGIYVGLTGKRLNSDDCIALGITQQKISHANLPALIPTLASHPFDDDPHAAVTHVIDQFKIPVKPSVLLENKNALDTCFALDSVEEILRVAQQSSHAICQEAATELMKKSPTSLKVTLKAMLEGKHLDFDACMRREYWLTYHFMQGHDFIEGIRAVIIDKDQLPTWQPKELEQVTNAMVNSYFIDENSKPNHELRDNISMS